MGVKIMIDKEKMDLDNSIIVFDTNVWLEMYRVDEDKRYFYVSLLERYKENILITKQIDYEFYRNRENHKKTYEHLSKDFENKRNQLKTLLEKINFYLTEDKKLDYDGVFDKMKDLKTIELIKEEKKSMKIIYMKMMK
jgi:hypothetical protein